MTRDVYTRVTNHIIEAIERGAGTFRMPWHVTDADHFSPLNAVSKKPYRGVNVVSLWAAAEVKGYASGLWATYRQWQELGAQVRRGEESSLVVFWKVSEREREEADEETEPGRGRIFARGYSVFNVAQVEGYEVPTVTKRSEPERIQAAEAFFGALGADIRHGGNRACYRPLHDDIQMPPFEAFRDVVAYYSTLAHEATHWTGAKARLDRDLSGRFGTNAYAAEELVAELGAAFICADLGLSVEPRPDHAAYISSWLEVLRKDTRAIFTAASKAQQAADYMHGKQAERIAA